MNTVIESFAYHVAPIGPMGDYEARIREEEEWIDSLSLEDALELAEWIKSPSPVPNLVASTNFALKLGDCSISMAFLNFKSGIASFSMSVAAD